MGCLDSKLQASEPMRPNYYGGYGGGQYYGSQYDYSGQPGGQFGNPGVVQGQVVSGNGQGYAPGPWQCSRCTLENQGDFQHCVACQAPRPMGVMASPAYGPAAGKPYQPGQPGPAYSAYGAPAPPPMGYGYQDYQQPPPQAMGGGGMSTGMAAAGAGLAGLAGGFLMAEALDF
eukprot:gb/GFBE01068868.1/.p1 GENE.gb/GFBE01068868.1/~~gb/GFBE01068868.1/.p1  ORF type:complete len:173 (+),score=17.20 gb/GFBE01068868.1/:1-519(+)